MILSNYLILTKSTYNLLLRSTFNMSYTDIISIHRSILSLLSCCLVGYLSLRSIDFELSIQGLYRLVCTWVEEWSQNLGF